MTGFKSFEDFEIWQKSRVLANKIYELTRKERFSRDYAFRDQMRRAVLSIMSNIGEGFYRDGNPEFMQFLSISKGSAGEIKSQSYLAFDQGYIGKEEFEEIQLLINEIINRTGALIKYLKRSGSKGIKYSK